MDKDKVTYACLQLVFLPLPDLHFIFLEGPSVAISAQRWTSRLTLRSDVSGDAVQFTLLCRLTLGVVLSEVTVGFSVRRTAFLYPQVCK